MASTEPEHLPAVVSVRLVAGRELRTRLGSAGFTVGTLVTMVIVGILVLLPSFLGGDDTKTVAIVGLSQAQRAALGSDGMPGGRPDIKPMENEAEARQLVKDEDVAGTVIADASGLRITIGKKSDSALGDALNARLGQQALADELTSRGVNPAAVADAVDTVSVTYLKDDAGGTQRVVLAYVVSMILFTQIIGSGAAVAQGVVEEKSTRVIEILLAKVRPTPLLVGKVIGIGTLGLIQLVAVAVTGVATASIAGTLAIESTIIEVAGASLAWYLLGYAFYGFVYGGVGSMVSRQEELAGLTVPLQLLNSAALVAAVLGLQDIGANWLAVLSYIPPFSAIIVPMRMAGGVATPFEIIAPALILLLSTAAVAWLGGIVYNRSILNTGKRVKLAQALRRG
ncbi:ABC transporter permease [Streptomyces sp. OspMP-M43]|uniref:ABC transporter permease n=1 Tax=Streptomyces sp. OspMP-M43 TaxID=1839781 RepID=UPI00081B9E35|nr:ABC transporter permease [Streptomyces sp. OspMP-M43]SCE23068.1 ABC-2 type transport system permease protein [Streptomyces sp. OspMP-M43]